MKNLKKEFPVTKQYAHLNTAATGLMSQTVLDFRQDHDLDYLILGSLLKDKQDEFITQVREKVGRFFNCSPERVALTPNFSIGLNALLSGIKPESKFLLLEEDYPSINWPIESRKFEVVKSVIDENMEDRILDIVEKERPDVFAFSLVQYISGIKIDFEILEILKQRFPEMLIIADGTQYCGTEIFDFESSGIDILGASAYKWMNAGYGNAFFLMKKGIEARVFPQTIGFNSIRGKHKQQERSLIGMLEPGHQDTVAFGSLMTAIELIEKIGMPNIQTQIRNLQRKAAEAFAARGLLEKRVVQRNIQSPIFNITIPLKNLENLQQQLMAEGVICSLRGSGLRVSLHYYNTLDDLERLLRLI
ncbi:MAG: aminotransferase class V-fold PLP-dependent enzyme [Leeuwenhoekiella sp.]